MIKGACLKLVFFLIRRRQLPLTYYCTKRRGQFTYGPDCHAYVDCWDGQAFLKYCHPRNLVFDPSTMRCRWPNERAVEGRCDEQVLTMFLER